jgi:hypothetical protein
VILQNENTISETRRGEKGLQKIVQSLEHQKEPQSGSQQLNKVFFKQRSMEIKMMYKGTYNHEM